MPIQILPAQLANQIAAGEVVERPASVIKELLENSLDAGATRIDIEIEKGGSKRLLVRDNGCGVAEQELTLALSRHATSKVSSQDDLAQIQTLGFRGEALASISSVSRLTFTSKPAEQEAAWQARAQGRDMDVEVLPAAHPIGTSVEVIDLFFNTPARRKFLRTEKTEFYHIDELIKRLALSRFDVAIRLKHNDKPVRNYRIAQTVEQQDKRVASVLGPTFISHCVRIDNQHEQLHLSGWLGLGEAARSGLDGQYFYVNGRMMRDKLINHAIRQSLADLVPEPLHPSYVLFLELPADQVDVNVHPAKHEVRFHHARLVHDYIVRVLSQVILSQQDLPATGTGEQPQRASQPVRGAEHGYQTQECNQVAEPRLETRAPNGGGYVKESAGCQPKPLQPASSMRRDTSPYSSDKTIQPSQQQANQQWLASLGQQSAQAEQSASQSKQRRPLHFVAPAYLLLSEGENLMLLSLEKAWCQLHERAFIDQWPQGLDRVPLLIPQRLELSPSDSSFLNQQQEVIRRLGFEAEGGPDNYWLLKQVPLSLRRSNFACLLPALITKLQALSDEGLTNPQLVTACLVEVSATLQQHSWQSALALFNQLEQGYPQELPAHLTRPVPANLLTELF